MASNEFLAAWMVVLAVIVQLPFPNRIDLGCGIKGNCSCAKERLNSSRDNNSSFFDINRYNLQWLNLGKKQADCYFSCFKKKAEY